MTWTITTTTTISASRAVTLAERIPGEPIKFVVLHPGTGAGGTVTIWDDLGRSVASTRIDALSPRHEAEFFSDRSIFNVSAAIDGNAALSGAGVSVYLVSREAPESSIADGSTSFAGPLRVAGDLEADGASFAGPLRVAGDLEADGASFAGPVRAPQIIRGIKARSAGSNLFYAAPTATSASAWTVGEQIPVAAPYWGVQPIFVNNDRTAVMAIGAAKIASAPTDNAAAEGLTWANLTVGLATAFAVPAATPDLATGVLKPGLLEGDPIPLASVARTDIPANSPLLHYRALFPSGGKFSAIASGNIAALRASTGQEHSSYLSNSDEVTAPTGSPAIASAAYRGVMFKFMFKSPVFDLLVIGDSTNSGTGSNSSIFTAAREAKRLASFPMEVVNFAIGGQTMRYAYNHWRAIIASGYRPRAVLIPTWTVNTSLNAAGFANTITYAMAIASEAMDLGIIPILQTPPPASSLTGGNITLWQAHYAMVLALDGQYIVVDQTKSVMDPNDPAHYLAALTADGLHPNEAGHVAKGVDLLPVLERIAQ